MISNRTALAAATIFLALFATTPRAEHALVRITEDGSGITREIQRGDFDIGGARVGQWVDVVADEAAFSKLRTLGATWSVRVPSLENQFAAIKSTAESKTASDFGLFHTYDEVAAELDSLATLYPTLARRDSIGVSWEGRTIWALKISDQVALSEPEPRVLYTGCYHAREIITPEIPILFARHLLDNYGIDSEITALVDDREVWIVPIVNPDGHQYVVDVDPLWRKNRRPNADSTTTGVDLNRNHNAFWAWDDLGSEPNGNSGIYRGSAPVSEPEIQAIESLKAAQNFAFALSFHSFGDLYLYGWSHIRLRTPHDELFRTVGDSMAAANGYVVGAPIDNVIYIVNGDAGNDAYADTLVADRTFSFTPEVGSLFTTGEDSIAFHYNENLPAMMFILRHADDPYQFDTPGAPVFASVPNDADGDFTLNWTKGAGGDTTVVAYQLIERTGSAVVIDSAENGLGNWITDGWIADSTRQVSGQYSFWSGTGDLYESWLASRDAVEIAAGDSLAFQVRWRAENGSDYWYVEATRDGGRTWLPIPGPITTATNPAGNNAGNGITSNSGWQRVAFDLSAFAGEEIRYRFRYWTDEIIGLRGPNIDDIELVRTFAQTDTLTTTETGTSFAIAGRSPDVYYYEVRGQDAEGNWGAPSRLLSVTVETPTGVADVGGGVDVIPVTTIRGNRPNPFNPATMLSFSVSSEGPVHLTVHDLAGRVVATLIEEIRPAGEQSVGWNGRNALGEPVSSGIYFARLRSAGLEEVHRMVLIR